MAAVFSRFKPDGKFLEPVKKKIYSAGKQYHTKDVLQHAIVTAIKAVFSGGIEKLMDKTHRRLFSVSSNGGTYI